MSDATGSDHEHIANLRCVDETGKAWDYPVATLVAYIEQHGNNSVWCAGAANTPSVWLQVYKVGAKKHVRTAADGAWTNNLLALPLY